MKRSFMVRILAIFFAVILTAGQVLAEEPTRSQGSKATPIQFTQGSSGVTGEAQLGAQTPGNTFSVTAKTRVAGEGGQGNAGVARNPLLDPSGNLASKNPNGADIPPHLTPAWRMRAALDKDDGSPAKWVFPKGMLFMEMPERKAILWELRNNGTPEIQQLVQALEAKFGGVYDGDGWKNELVAQLFEMRIVQIHLGKTNRAAVLRGYDEYLAKIKAGSNVSVPGGFTAGSGEFELSIYAPAAPAPEVYIHEVPREYIPWYVWVLLTFALLFPFLCWFIARRLGYKPADDKLRDKEREIGALDEQNKENAAKAANEKARADAAEKELAKAQEANHKQEVDAATAAEKIKNLEADNQKLNGDLNTANSKATEQEKRADKAEADLAKANDSITALTKERDDANRRAGDAEAKLEQARDQAAKDAEKIRELERDKLLLQKEVEDLTAQLAEARANINRLERENGGMAERIKLVDSLTEQLREKSTQLEKVENKLNRLSFSLRKLNKSFQIPLEFLHGEGDSE